MSLPLPSLVAALADRYRLERELGQGGMRAATGTEQRRESRKRRMR